ncbi:hypothetical protein [Erythrobacter sp. JK5]|uniref:hypothetical protein n=1 Tax=Erythrobacter sp. JK5 TaxID=2829500 RepID=UPI001BA6E780|nr:hypothetical protein [Erythrobacter sp. JK5]QUL37148.1 hypothetical protein KDC96_12235 [Erythrobacter sp. JK5]
MEDVAVKRAGQKVGLGSGLGGASLGIIFALWTSEAIDTPTFPLLLAIPAALFALALRNLASLRKGGLSSPATWRYLRDFFASIAVYMLGLGIAIWLWNSIPGARGFALPIALLPTLPTFAMVYVMARYLAEEKDEYLRYRTTQAALVGLGFVLVLGSFWGFMETFGVVPNIWAWWVVPVWAIGFGIGQTWLTQRDNAAGDDS